MAKKRGKKKSSSKRSAQGSNAGAVLKSLELDTRHVASEPLLRKLAEGKATAEDVNKAIDEDSRLEPLRDVMTKIASGQKVSPKEIDDAIDSKNEPLRPLLEACNKG